MGRKVQPRLASTLESKRTRIFSSSTVSEADSATLVVPAKPVTRQNQE